MLSLSWTLWRNLWRNKNRRKYFALLLINKGKMVEMVKGQSERRRMEGGAGRSRLRSHDLTPVTRVSFHDT